MERYYKITAERLVHGQVFLLTVKVNEFSVIPYKLDYELLTSEQQEAVRDDITQGIHYKRSMYTQIDAVIAEVERHLNDENTRIYLEYAFESSN
ncbi:hypothetical protein D9N27_09245 [Listeria monocytogenes]|uniref:hypothetical protein n=1 Tax=Listeria seeligeri TaxID=1640 RepID=UPI0010B75CD8|nr:hypothetical protein [Listeria seeligeri]EAC4184095.1 hypothetical protein [Listeria monocytogenes]EEO3421826.1 hypothetical protein [Listeria monocytogenes]MBF2629996.1 hypothetical protein [Listeria seeligeri]